jgi:hypothetical protein
VLVVEAKPVLVIDQPLKVRRRDLGKPVGVQSAMILDFNERCPVAAVWPKRHARAHAMTFPGH